MPRKPKKDETLEVRLAHDTKRAFMERCRDEGRTASEAVRDFIEAHLARPLVHKEPAMHIPRTMPLMAAASLGLVGLAFFAASPSRAGPDLKAQFNMMDVNGDGVVTSGEFADNPARAKTVAVVAERPPGSPAGAPSGAPLGTVRLPLAGTAAGDPPPLPTGARLASAQERADLEQRAFAEIDKNGDSTVSFVEFEQHHRALIKRSFQMLDRDGDGGVSVAEFETPTLRVAAASPDGVKAPAPLPPPPADLFAKLDKNKDGKVSEQEFVDRD